MFGTAYGSVNLKTLQVCQASATVLTLQSKEVDAYDVPSDRVSAVPLATQAGAVARGQLRGGRPCCVLSNGPGCWHSRPLRIEALQKNLWVIQWGSHTSFDDGVIWMTLPMMNPARGIFSGIDSCVQ